MKKNLIITIVIAIVVIAIIGTVFFLLRGETKCPQCSSPGAYSSCDSEFMKSRTNYKCNEETNFECESYTEKIPCATEIMLTGNIQGTISPSLEEKVKGVVKLELTEFPEGTMVVVYYLEGGDLPPIGPDSRGPVLTFKQGNIWTALLDTTEYENGIYEINIVSYDKMELEGNPQGFAQTQMLISN